jgi:hypothetical protein
MSRDFVVNHIVKFATEVTGNSYHGALYSGFKDIKTDLKTRVSFKVRWYLTFINFGIGVMLKNFEYIVDHHHLSGHYYSY